MRQEVISNEETHEDPVIHTALKVKGKRQAGHRQLSGEVLKIQRESSNWDLMFHIASHTQNSQAVSPAIVFYKYDKSNKSRD